MNAGKPLYPKSLLSFEDQAKRLIARGMLGNEATIVERLRSTNYYRLSGYFYFFRTHQGAQKHVSERYRDGLTFDQVWDLYTFDCKLRTLVSRAIEKIEIAARTQVAFHHAKKFGPTAYALDPKSVELQRKGQASGADRYREYIADIDKLIRRSHEQFIEAFYENYGDKYPPIWIASEVLTLGCIKHIFEGCPLDVRRDISRHFNVPHAVFESWLLTLNTARNVCAHHGRFWNRALGTPPMVPIEKLHPGWHRPVVLYVPPPAAAPLATRPPTTFVILSICNHLLSEIDPGCGWAKEVKALLDAHPDVSRSAMGFPQNWSMSPVWHDID